MKKFNVAVVGATGLVGREILKILAERNFPIHNLKCFASSKSAGSFISYKDSQIKIQTITSGCFRDVDIALVSIGSALSKKYSPQAVNEGAWVIDNSNAFRMQTDIPLIIPEINKEVINNKNNRLIANPNCSTIQLLLPLKPIYDYCGIERIVVTTYQSVSGSGKKAVDELKRQSKAILQKQKVKSAVYPHQIAFNCLPHIDIFLENGYSREEMKLVNETRKILDDQNIGITPTAVRVPVFIGHSEAVYIETGENIALDKVKELLHKSPGVKVIDNLLKFEYPLAIDSKNDDNVLVGRLRKDLAKENGINMWIVGNNLRKGAALNAVQIAEHLVRKNLV